MIHVIFVEPESSGNIGSIARAMKNFSLKNLILVNPQCEVENQDSRKMSMHAWDIIENARVVNSFEKAIDGMDFVIGTTAKTRKGYDEIKTAYSPREVVPKLKQVAGNTAIVFGRESRGLTDEELKKCDINLFIPTNPDYSTMNITHAAAVIFYELFASKESTVRKADLKQKEELLKAASQAIDSVELKDKEKTKRIFSNVINRALISGKESQTLTGFFKKLIQMKK